MTRSLRPLFALSLLLPSLGCAGGWRGGSAPAEWATRSAPTAGAASATASAMATPAKAQPAGAKTSGGTHATPDGAEFAYGGNAVSVNVAGEFNSWSTGADPLTKQANGSWSLKKKLAPGRYLYKFVLDGGTWKEDPGATESADDGYGGKNSVIVVGGAAAAGGAVTMAPAATAGTPAANAAPAVKPVTGSPRAPQFTADGVVFTYAGQARSVSLCGAFNQWAPNADPMQQQADGTWVITKRLPPGAHGYKFLIDGSNWKADEANPDGQDDGFGGRNSLVTVK